MIEGDILENPDELRRRLGGKRAGRPGEGFADIRIVTDPVEEIETIGQQLYRLSRRMRRLCDYEDNPDQFMMRCPKCDLMNDFTSTGQQIFYFESEWKGDRPPDHSTTPKRISVIRYEGDRAICKCGNCGEEFEPESSPDPIPFLPSPDGRGPG
ncbi:hypothetical protein HYZ98_01150 [Candidatus Peregrinibacteria bacterium]|nr:hypothetical protein [Candidatus Peregrinibacteria bacterium]